MRAHAYLFFSVCSGPGGHLHSGLVHRDYVCCGSHRAHPTHSLLHQKEPRGKVPRYSGDSSYSVMSNSTTNVSLNTVKLVLISVREKKDISLEPVDDKDQEGTFDYRLALKRTACVK